MASFLLREKAKLPQRWVCAMLATASTPWKGAAGASTCTASRVAPASVRFSWLLFACWSAARPCGLACGGWIPGATCRALEKQSQAHRKGGTTC